MTTLELTRKQFDILTVLEEVKEKLSQRELSEKTGYGLGTINKVLKELAEKEYIHEGVVAAKGIEALEPYRVKRAVIIAAGFGSRMMPITLNTPKPLVRVHGKRIIDSLLDAIIAAGIEEIIIVRGYLAEQFDQLLYKYPMIKFVENPSYNEANNISSAMCVRYMLRNAYVFEADLLLMNPSLVRKYQYASNYLGIPVERSDDWCFTTKNGIIQTQQVGGELNPAKKAPYNGLFQEVGLSYWSDTDGARLAEHLEEVYNMPGGKERYWDQAPFVYFKEQYQIEVRECSFNDIVEIDTFRELKQIDKTYDV